MTYNRYAEYPPEWDEEPDFPEGFDELEPPDEDEPEPPMETPEGNPVDDLWHAQRAEDRDRFLHPPDPFD